MLFTIEDLVKFMVSNMSFKEVEYWFYRQKQVEKNPYYAKFVSILKWKYIHKMLLHLDGMGQDWYTCGFCRYYVSCRKCPLKEKEENVKCFKRFEDWWRIGDLYLRVTKDVLRKVEEVEIEGGE